SGVSSTGCSDGTSSCVAGAAAGTTLAMAWECTVAVVPGEISRVTLLSSGLMATTVPKRPKLVMTSEPGSSCDRSCSCCFCAFLRPRNIMKMRNANARMRMRVIGSKPDGAAAWANIVEVKGLLPVSVLGASVRTGNRAHGRASHHCIGRGWTFSDRGLTARRGLPGSVVQTVGRAAELVQQGPVGGSREAEMFPGGGHRDPAARGAPEQALAHEVGLGDGFHRFRLLADGDRQRRQPDRPSPELG